MTLLVGNTGFVGSNLALCHDFDMAVHSTNISNAFGTNPDLCVYAGVRAEKFLANKNPETDMAHINEAIENIKKINPKRLVLISTIDVFKNPNGADEDAVINLENHHAYGSNRHVLEKWVAENIENYHIIRLPGLFGKNMKKNFIYDLMHPVPKMLNAAKYAELSADELIKNSYELQDNGFYLCTAKDVKPLETAFNNAGFSTVNFTDSRGIFQFYYLANLWKHIEIAVKNNIKLLHLAVEPICVNEIYSALYGKEFTNEIANEPPYYDFKTKYAEIFGGKNGYLADKETVLSDILKLIKEESER